MPIPENEKRESQANQNNPTMLPAGRQQEYASISLDAVAGNLVNISSRKAYVRWSLERWRLVLGENDACGWRWQYFYR
jgi:hypothetical protein